MILKNKFMSLKKEVYVVLIFCYIHIMLEKSYWRDSYLLNARVDSILARWFFFLLEPVDFWWLEWQFHLSSNAS